MTSYSKLLGEVRYVGLESDENIIAKLQKYQELENSLGDHEITTQKIARQIQTRCNQKRKNPFEKTPPRTHTQEKSYYLGKDWKTQVPYSLPASQLPKHVLISAATGAGKTTLIQQFLTQLDKPFWALDLKQDYRHLQKHRDVIVIPQDQLRINPLKPPPGVTWQNWKSRVIEVFCDAVHLLDASQNYIHENWVQVYENHLEQLSLSTGKYPTLHDLVKQIEQQDEHPSSKKGQYQATVLNRLKKFTEPPNHEIFNHPTGYDLEYLLQRNVVFELDKLPADVQNFLMELLLEWIYQYRYKHPTMRGTGLHQVVVIDEAKQLFDKTKEEQIASGIPHIDFLTSKIRELGVGLMAADQEAEKLTDTLKANTNTKIILPNADHNQVEEMSKSMGLSPLQENHVPELGTGEAIITEDNNGPYRINVHNPEIEKQVTDTQVLKSLRQETFYKATNGLPKHHEQPIHNQEQGFKPVEQPEQLSNTLSEEAQQLLEEYARNPFKKLTDHYIDCFDSRTTGNKAKNELLRKEFFTEPVTVNTGYGTRKLYGFTEEAENYLNNRELEIQWKGKGGVEHKFWQHRISQLLENQGWNTILEEQDADIYASKNNGDEELIVEVALNTDDKHELDHVQKHLDHGITRIIITVPRQSKKKRLQEKIEEADLDNDSVTVKTLQKINRQPHLLKIEP